MIIESWQKVFGALDSAGRFFWERDVCPEEKKKYPQCGVRTLLVVVLMVLADDEAGESAKSGQWWEGKGGIQNSNMNELKAGRELKKQKQNSSHMMADSVDVDAVGIGQMWSADVNSWYQLTAPDNDRREIIREHERHRGLKLAKSKTREEEVFRKDPVMRFSWHDCYLLM